MLPQSRTLIYAHSDTGTRLVGNTLWNMGGGGGVSCTKILGGFGFRKWHLQHSENTFRKKVGFQNTAKQKTNISEKIFSIYIIIYAQQKNIVVPVSYLDKNRVVIGR